MRPTRKILIAALVLVGLFYGANIAAQKIAEAKIADQAQKSFHTSKKPVVTLDGFPILLKILQGRIPRARLFGENLTVRDLRLASLDVQLEGIHAKLADLSAGRAILVERGLATASVPEASINTYVRSRGFGGAIEVRASDIRVKGQIAGVGAASADGVPRVVGRLLTFSPQRVVVAGRPVSGAVLAAARKRLAFEVDLPELPGGMRITGIDFAPHLVSLIATIDHANFTI